MMEQAKTDRLIAALKSDDAEVRKDAWLGAAEAGPDAVEPLARLMAEGEMEVSRAAKRALWRVVRDLGSPEAGPAPKREVVGRLRVVLAGGLPEAVRREALWMFSELAESSDAASIGGLLTDEGLREDARCALERIPGGESLQILRAELERAPEEFKMNLVQSLRARGETVSGYPCRKLVPKS